MYIITDNNISRDDGSFIPTDLANRDYQDYLIWSAAGNIAIIRDSFPSIKADAFASLQIQRDVVVAELSGIAIAASAAGDSVTLNAALAARQGFIDIFTQPSITAATIASDLRTAIVSEKNKIISAMPPALRQLLLKIRNGASV